jgi:hypothetical protein
VSPPLAQASFTRVTSAVALAQTDSQADSLATWLGVIGQWVGAMGTLAAVGVALWLAQRGHRREVAEQRDREATQARLVIITVDYSDYHTHAISSTPWRGW